MPGLSLPKILTRSVGTSEVEVCEALMVHPPYPARSAPRRRGPPDGHRTVGVGWMSLTLIAGYGARCRSRNSSMVADLVAGRGAHQWLRGLVAGRGCARITG